MIISSHRQRKTKSKGGFIRKTDARIEAAELEKEVREGTILKKTISLSMSSPMIGLISMRKILRLVRIEEVRKKFSI